MSTAKFMKGAVSAVAYPLTTGLSNLVMSILTVALPAAAVIHAIPSPGARATPLQIAMLLVGIAVFAILGNKVVYDWHALVKASAEGRKTFISGGHVEGRAPLLEDRAEGTVFVLIPVVVIVAIFRTSPISVVAILGSFAFLPIINLHGMGYARPFDVLRRPLSYAVVAASEVILWTPIVLVVFQVVVKHDGHLFGRLSHIPAELMAGVLVFQMYWAWVNARIQGHFAYTQSD